MRVLQWKFCEPWGLNHHGDALEVLPEGGTRPVYQYRTILSVLVEGEVYTQTSVHSVEEVRSWSMPLAEMERVLRRHHQTLIMTHLERLLFPE